MSTFSPLAKTVISDRSKGVLWGLGAAVIAASYVVAGQYANHSGYTPEDLMLLRFAGAFIIIGPFAIYSLAKNYQKIASDFKAWLVIGLCAGPLFAYLIFHGLAIASKAAGSVIPFVSMSASGVLFSKVFLGTKTQKFQLLGFTVIVFGLGIMNWNMGESIANLAGALMLLGAGTAWGFFGVISRKFAIPPLLGTFWVVTLGLVCTVPYYLLVTIDLNHFSSDYQSLAIQLFIQGGLAGIGTVLCYAFAVRYLGANKAAYFPTLVPLFAFGANSILGSHFSELEILDVITVCVGMVMANRKNKHIGADK